MVGEVVNEELSLRVREDKLVCGHLEEASVRIEGRLQELVQEFSKDAATVDTCLVHTCSIHQLNLHLQSQIGL